MNLIHACMAFTIGLTIAACDTGNGSRRSDGSALADGTTAVAGSQDAGGLGEADGANPADAPLETGGSHGPADFSECFGASQNVRDCDSVCAATRQICVARGCAIDSAGNGITFRGFKTGFQCKSEGSTVRSRGACSDSFPWDGTNFMVVRCCCADVVP